jgi:hypothetical protein
MFFFFFFCMCVFNMAHVDDMYEGFCFICGDWFSWGCLTFQI